MIFDHDCYDDYASLLCSVCVTVQSIVDFICLSSLHRDDDDDDDGDENDDEEEEDENDVDT